VCVNVYNCESLDVAIASQSLPTAIDVDASSYAIVYVKARTKLTVNVYADVYEYICVCESVH